MATTLDSFSEEKFLAATPTNVFSTTGSQKKYIGKFTLTNTGTTAEEVILWRLNDTTTPTTTSPGGNWLKKLTVPAGATLEVLQLAGHVLDRSMKIAAQTDTASTVSSDVSGTTESS